MLGAMNSNDIDHALTLVSALALAIVLSSMKHAFGLARALAADALRRALPQQRDVSMRRARRTSTHRDSVRSRIFERSRRDGRRR